MLDAESLRVQAYTNLYNSTYQVVLAGLRLRRGRESVMGGSQPRSHISPLRLLGTWRFLPAAALCTRHHRRSRAGRSGQFETGRIHPSNNSRFSRADVVDNLWNKVLWLRKDDPSTRLHPLLRPTHRRRRQSVLLPAHKHKKQEDLGSHSRRPRMTRQRGYPTPPPQTSARTSLLSSVEVNSWSYSRLPS